MALRQPQRRDFEVCGLRLAGFEWSGEDPAVVLLHPNRTNSRVWDHMVAASASRRRFLAIDHRGHGESDWPEAGYALDNYVADDIELLDAMAGSKPIVLVGAATGGTVALLVASRRPDLVQALVVVDPGLSLDPSINARVQGELVAQYHQPDVATAMGNMPFSDGWTDDVLEHFARHSLARDSNGSVTWKYRLAAAQETEEALEADVWGEISIDRPTLAVRGALSNVFDDTRAHRLSSIIPGLEITSVEGANHRVMQDQPVRLAVVLDDFIERHGGGESTSFARR